MRDGPPHHLRLQVQITTQIRTMNIETERETKRIGHILTFKREEEVAVKDQNVDRFEESKLYPKRNKTVPQ